MKAAPLRRETSSGFTLVELMVSLVLISLICLLLFSIMDSTSAAWRYTSSRTEQFRGANTAFESITRRLSQATLNTYWDYDNPAAPTEYIRQSDLRFIVGTTEDLLGTTPRRPTQSLFFQAPLGYVSNTSNFSGLENLINTWGYYIEFGDDSLQRPSFITATTVPYRNRYRLMELMQPADALSIYGKDSGGIPYNSSKKWFSEALKATPSLSHPLAENIIALVLQPKLSKNEEKAKEKLLAPQYSYDSTATNSDPEINPRNQLPPIVQVTLVAIDEASAQRIANGSTPPFFDAFLDTLFHDVREYDADLLALQNMLSNAKPPINFRVFTTSVSIRGAKWSQN